MGGRAEHDFLHACQTVVFVGGVRGGPGAGQRVTAGFCLESFSSFSGILGKTFLAFATILTEIRALNSSGRKRHMRGVGGDPGDLLPPLRLQLKSRDPARRSHVIRRKDDDVTQRERAASRRFTGKIQRAEKVRLRSELGHSQAAHVSASMLGYAKGCQRRCWSPTAAAAQVHCGIPSHQMGGAEPGTSERTEP